MTHLYKIEGTPTYFFDVDGTKLDSEKAVLYWVNETLGSYELEPISDQELKDLRKLPNVASLDEICGAAVIFSIERFKIDQKNFNKVSKEYGNHRRYGEEYANFLRKIRGGWVEEHKKDRKFPQMLNEIGIEVIPGALEIFYKIELTEKIATCAVTNKPKYTLAYLHAFGIEPNEFISHTDMGSSAGKEDYIGIGADKLGSNLDYSFMIGDTVSDIKGGIKAGIGTVIAYSGPGASGKKDDMESVARGYRGFYEVDSLHDVIPIIENVYRLKF